jgi:hypothetical protein
VPGGRQARRAASDERRKAGRVFAVMCEPAWAWSRYTRRSIAGIRPYTRPVAGQEGIVGAAPSDAAESDAAVGQHAGRGGPGASRSNGAGRGSGGGGGGGGRGGGRGARDEEGHTVDLPQVLRHCLLRAAQGGGCEQKHLC